MTVAAAAGVNGTIGLLSPGMGVASTVFSCRLSRTPLFRLTAFASCTQRCANQVPPAAASLEATAPHQQYKQLNMLSCRLAGLQAFCPPIAAAAFQQDRNIASHLHL